MIHLIEKSDTTSCYDDLREFKTQFFIPASNEPGGCEAIQTSFDSFGECREIVDLKQAGERK